MKGRIFIVLIFSAAFAISGFLVFKEYDKNIKVINTREFNHAAPHLANEPGISIKNVRAKIVYFSPSDLSEKTNWPWQEKLNSVIEEEKNFFNNQLHNEIDFAIYPEIIIGTNDHKYYDGENTDNGNPNALLSVREEILTRVFSPAGDKYLAAFAEPSKNYELLVIIYEGTGAAAMIYQNGKNEGTDVVKVEKDGIPAIILSSAFLNSPYYVEFGPTILAHEIGHSLGLSDSYEKTTGAELSSDLMGEGRRRVLGATYISENNKKLLGAD